MGDTYIEATYTSSDGKIEQVILRLDGTRRAHYYQDGTVTEYAEAYPNGKRSFHVMGRIGSGATAPAMTKTDT